MTIEELMQHVQKMRENHQTHIGPWCISYFNMGKDHIGLAVTRDSGAWSVQIGSWYLDIWKNLN